MKYLLFFLTLLIAGLGHSQNVNPHLSKQKAAIAKLSGLAGKWKGTAITQQGPGQTLEMTQHENIEFKLDSTIIVIEGKGFDESDSLVFNAMAVVSYNGAEEAYEMKSYTNTGMETDATFELTELGFNWGFATPRGGKIKYEAQLTESTWTEKGYFSQDGNQWFEFVTLDLVKEHE